MDTSQGAATIPKRVTKVTIDNNVVKAALANSQATCLLRRVRYSVNTGMKAEDMDPSANNSRRRLGMRKATKKASAAGVAPNSRANTMSRMKPRMRLDNVATPTTPAASNTECVSSLIGAAEAGAAVGSDMNRDSSGTLAGSLSNESSYSLVSFQRDNSSAAASESITSA